MRFRFTLQRENIVLLKRLLHTVSKFWGAQRVFFYCDTSGVRLYPENISVMSPTYCEIFFASPARTEFPKAEQNAGAAATADVSSAYRQFFETYVVMSEKPNSRIIFSPQSFAEFLKTVTVLSNYVESSCLFKLTQEVVNNYVKVLARSCYPPDRNIWCWS